jgi:ubiquinone/menaquinone biosynthesis C-methylase UbiE
LSDDAWREYWAGGDGAEAVGGAQRHKLAARWAAFFSLIKTDHEDALVIDVAAGRGVALKSAIEGMLSRGRFLALDLSAAAVGSVMRAHSVAVGAAADAARLPIADQSAYVVVSQFGMEYAGVEAFAEGARVLSPRGRFCSIAHYRNGAIDAECAENERILLAAGSAGLIAAAQATLEASYRARSRRVANPVDPTLDATFASIFAKSKSVVAAAPPSAARAMLEKFLADLLRLSARRMAFDEKEALGWLGGMKASLDAYLGRMKSMRGSALDAAAINDIAARFAAAGLLDFRAEPLLLDEQRAPAAWVIEARRPA